MDLSDPDASRKRKLSAVDKPRRNSSAAVVDEADQARKELDIMLNKVRCLTITKFMLERTSEVS
jgi:condensin complex subunit 3